MSRLDIRIRLHRWFFKDYEDAMDELIKKNAKLFDCLKTENALLKSKIVELQPPDINPFNWKNYTNKDYKTIIMDGLVLDVPPNTYITPNDRSIKEQVMKSRLKKDHIIDTAVAIKKWIYKNITYVGEPNSRLHKGAIEYFQPASVTFQFRIGDCDDMVTLFHTMMYICGYGDKTISCVDRGMKTIWWDGRKIGHAFNMVFDEEWVVFDANAGTKQDKVKYPIMDDLTYWFNYHNIYTS